MNPFAQLDLQRIISTTYCISFLCPVSLLKRDPPNLGLDVITRLVGESLLLSDGNIFVKEVDCVEIVGLHDVQILEHKRG